MVGIYKMAEHNNEEDVPGTPGTSSSLFISLHTRPAAIP